MSNEERAHIAARLGHLSVMCRMGRITLAQVDEQINHIQWLLDHPGWQVNRPINEREAA